MASRWVGYRAQRARGSPPRVEHSGGPPLGPHDGSGFEVAEAEPFEVEVGDPRIAGVEDLEPLVDDEAVDPLGRQPPADDVRGVEQVHVPTGGLQADRRGQAGEAGAHDEHLGAGRE